MLHGAFRPEFLNRLDEIIYFKGLMRGQIGAIIDLMMNDVNRRLADKRIHVTLSESAKDRVIEDAYSPQYGARPLRRYIQRNVETLLAKAILRLQVQEESNVVINVRDGELVADAVPAQTVPEAT